MSLVPGAVISDKDLRLSRRTTRVAAQVCTATASMGTVCLDMQVARQHLPCMASTQVEATAYSDALNNSVNEGAVKEVDDGTGPGVVGSSIGGKGVFGEAANGTGVQGDTVSGTALVAHSTGHGIGLRAKSISGTAIVAQSGVPFSAGTLSVSNTGTGYGIVSSASGAAGYFTSTNSIGVYGLGTNDSGVRRQPQWRRRVWHQRQQRRRVWRQQCRRLHAGVYGTNTDNNGVGIKGEANTGSGAIGVFGTSTSGNGVRGISGRGRPGCTGTGNAAQA